MVAFFVIAIIFLLILLLLIYLRKKIYLEIELNYDSTQKLREFELRLILWFITLGRFILENSAQNKKKTENQTKDKNKDEITEEGFLEKILENYEKAVFYLANIEEIYKSVIRLNKIEVFVELGAKEPDKVAIRQGLLYVGESLFRLLIISLFDVDKIKTKIQSSMVDKPFEKIKVFGIINVKFTHTIWEIVKLELKSKFNKCKKKNKEKNNSEEKS